MIKLLIADDHLYITEGVQGALEGYDINVVGKVAALDDLELQIDELSPDIILLDIMFGGKQTGIQFAEKYLSEPRDVKIIMFSQYDDGNIVKSAYDAGVSCFLSKNSNPDELYAAIKSVKNGEMYMPDDIAQNLAISVVASNSAGPENPRDVLSERELAIFKSIAQGHTAAEIIKSTGYAQRTIAYDIAKCREKLHISRHADFTRLAIKFGLIELN